MKKLAVFLMVFFLGSILGAQQKFALVIGNSNYSGIATLRNPQNDARDMGTALASLGFEVDILLDGSSEQMEGAITNLRRKLSADQNSYGFFYYAGHGVQSAGDNYLIPVNAESINDEITMRHRAISLQFIMDNFDESANELNIVVLDSCRDNPFSWSRSGTRGFAVINRIPRGSIIFYATSDGKPAADGTGRNGLFTGYLLDYITTPGMEISQIFRLTGDAVSKATGGGQIPAIYDQFFRPAYLDSQPMEGASSSIPVPISDSITSPRNTSLSQVSSANTYYDQGVDFFGKGEFELAIMAFNEAIKLDNNYSFAYSYRALAYNSKRDNDQCITDSNRAIFLNSGNWMGYLARGMAYRDKNDYEKGIADLTHAIELNPNYAPIYYNRALAFRYRREYDRAIADYTKAIEIDRNYTEAYNGRGNVYNNNLSNYNRAIEDYTEAIKINPNYVTAYNNRGTAYDRMGDKEKARENYEAALRIEPDDTAARRNLQNLR